MTDPVPQRASRWLDRDFRWRGTEVTRLEAFGDAVFALVLALLFLQSEPLQSIGQLKAAMKGLAPFAVMFLLLAMVWVEHHRFHRRYGLVDKTTFFGNLGLLFLVLFYAYPLKFMFTSLYVMWFGPIGAMTHASIQAGFEPGDNHRLMTFYGSGFGAIYLTFAWLYRHALRRADELGLDEVERHATVTSLLSCLVLVAFAATSVAMSLLRVGNGSMAGWIYFGIGPAMAALHFRRGAQQGQLVAARAVA